MKRYLLVVAPLGLLAGVALLNASRGQGFQVGPGAGAGFGVPVPAATRTRSEISQLVGELRDATDDAKKTEITKKLEAAVTKAFDEDQKTRETELTKLEERLKKLRTQLERRTKAKADIIQLQLKVLANEAEGLGFSGTSLLEGHGRIIAYPALPGGANALEPAAGAAPAARK